MISPARGPSTTTAPSSSGAVDTAPTPSDWDNAERSVVLGLAEHDLPDRFRALNGYSPRDSWVARRGTQQWGHRYDHIFASRRLGPTACCYHHEWREHRLSDHSAIEADFAA